MQNSNVLRNADDVNPGKFNFAGLARFCISEFSCKDDIEIIVIVPNFCKTKRFLKINVVVGPLDFFYKGDALNIVLAFSLLFFPLTFLQLSLEYCMLFFLPFFLAVQV